MKRAQWGTTVAGLATVGLAVVTAGLAAALALSSTAVAVPAAARRLSVTIGVATKEPVVTGDSWVEYHEGAYATATLSGHIAGLEHAGEAKLFSETFPFKTAPRVSQAVHLAGRGSTSYSFKVAPSLATKYFVEVSEHSASVITAGTSRTVTVYVSSGGKLVGRYQSCNSGYNRPMCHQSFGVEVYLPPDVARFEMSKHLYTYLAVALAPSQEPPAPRILFLSRWKVTTRAVAPGKYLVSYSFSFNVGNDAYHWAWNSCWKDTESTDGFGLPGHHGCGNPSILSAAKYLG